MPILPSLVSIDILPSIRSVQNQKTGKIKFSRFLRGSIVSFFSSFNRSSSSLDAPNPSRNWIASLHFLQLFEWIPRKSRWLPVTLPLCHLPPILFLLLYQEFQKDQAKEAFPKNHSLFFCKKKKCNDPFGFANEKRSSETTGCYTEDGEKNIGEEKRHPKYRDWH